MSVNRMNKGSITDDIKKNQSRNDGRGFPNGIWPDGISASEIGSREEGDAKLLRTRKLCDQSIYNY